MEIIIIFIFQLFFFEKLKENMKKNFNRKNLIFFTIFFFFCFFCYCGNYNFLMRENIVCRLVGFGGRMEGPIFPNIFLNFPCDFLKLFRSFSLSSFFNFLYTCTERASPGAVASFSIAFTKSLFLSFFKFLKNAQTFLII